MSRPISRQSTQSVDSNATQPLPPPSSHRQHPLVPPQAWQQHVPIPQPQVQFQPPPPMMPANTNALAMLETRMAFQGGPIYAPTGFSFDRLNSPAVSSVEGDMGGALDGNSEEAPKKKGSGASLANDQELRRLYRENLGRSLQDVANEVKNEQKGPKAEKAKQVFGMLWLHQNIKKSNQSVPRNRVYSFYAKRCGDSSLPLLNPASFGKLVRIIFPNINTRRLGVRGESKYHYVALSLVNDDGRDSVPPGAPDNVKPELPRPRTSSNQQHIPPAPDRAVFPSFGSPPKRPEPTQQQSRSGTSTLYLQHNYASAGRTIIPTRKDIMGRKLRWPDPTGEVNQDGPLELPPIDQYLPPGTDMDAASSLAAVYRSHCLQATDSFRYCQTDAFSDSFKSLIGLLTVPSQKLLAHPQVSAWIEACDVLKYQRMVPLLRNIVLARVPPAAMTHMEKVAEELCSWITQYFSTQPQHVLETMLKPASTFVSMLARFIRVNRVAHDLDNIFADDHIRDELWSQWVHGSQPLQVVEGTCDPQSGGHHRLLSMLTQEACFILRPSAEAIAKVSNGLFQAEPWTGKQPPDFLAFQAREEELAAQRPNEPKFSRLVRFMEDIPNRYPGVCARDILVGMETALGITGRNMALNQTGTGFGHFWTVNLFMSEMLYWQAEVGGFLEAPALSPAGMQHPYMSPYQTVNGMNISSTTAPVARPFNSAGSESIQEQRDDGLAEQERQANAKMMKLAEGSWPIEMTAGSKARVSLGGDTVVGDDDFALDTTVDWGNLEKENGHFFGHDNSDTIGVTVR